MAILRIKDEYGNVHEVLALRGEKGDPGYVLTDADKEEIAGIVKGSDSNQTVSEHSTASGYNTIAGCKAFTVREVTNKSKSKLVTLTVPASILASYDTSTFRLRIQFSHIVNTDTTFSIKGADGNSQNWLGSKKNFYNIGSTSLTRYQCTRTHEGHGIYRFNFAALLNNAANSAGGIMSSPLGIPSALLDADGNFNVTLEVECGEEQDLGFVLSLMGDNANTEPSTTLYQHRKTFTVYSEEVRNLVIDNTEDIVIGDVWSLYSNQLGTNLDFYGTVTEVNDTSISVDKIPEDFVLLEEGKLTYIWFPYKPYLNGDQDIGAGSHSDGYDTIATSFGASSEGYNTVAGGKYSHVEGNSTKAGYAGHAQNLETEATGIAAHSQGTRTKATGRQSDANGLETIASGDNATSNGYRTTASGSNSDAGGFNTEAAGAMAVTRGLKTKATGDRDVAIGNETEASGKDSFAAGWKTRATRWLQAVFGSANAEDPDALFIVGNGSDDDDRKNAFVVKSDGSARLARSSTAANAVVTYGQMMDYVQKMIDSAITNLPDYNGYWDAYQENGNRTQYAYAFSGESWTDQNYNPKYPINVTGQSAFSAFSHSLITDTKVDIDISTATDVGQLFFGCYNLKTIRKLIVSNETPALTNAFAGCTALENITIEGQISKSISFADSPLLTEASVLSILNALKPISGQTITLDSQIGGQLTEEQQAYITASNWTLVY